MTQRCHGEHQSVATDNETWQGATQRRQSSTNDGGDGETTVEHHSAAAGHNTILMVRVARKHREC
jgi:hypothetical protein